MKIGYKILVTFMGVLTVSVTIFLMVCYYILNAGCYSGISRNDMKSAVSYGEKIFLEEKDDMTTLEKLENEYENMDFAILDNGAWKSLENLPVLADEKDILDAMNENLDSCEDYKVLAGAVEYGEKSIYISCFVEKTDFESMSYEFNMTRNKGILGKLAVLKVGSLFWILFLELKSEITICNDSLAIHLQAVDGASLGIKTEVKFHLAVGAGLLLCIACHSGKADTCNSQ